MRLLVVEGNTKETWEEREALGGVPYHKRFQSMLEILQPNAELEFAFPADNNDLPTIAKLKRFDGVLWTGSGLYINDLSLSVSNQLEFADSIFESGVPFYGSCWGMQIATVAAGGKVNKSKKGRELGITIPIELTEAGSKSPYFIGRGSSFTALCVHLDEVTQLPSNATVLARNNHSDVQAMTIQYKKTEFFGVQYHPEFEPSDMAFITKYMSSALIDEGLFDSISDIEGYLENLEEQSKSNSDVGNYSLHTQEVKQWLMCLST